jgi:hypothetical protein
MRTLDRATGAAAGGRIILTRHRHIGFGVRPPRGRGAVGKTIAVVTASFLAAGLMGEMPAQAVASKQASRIQIHDHDKRATKTSKRIRVRHRQHRHYGQAGRMHRTKLRAAGMVARGGWSHRHFNCLNRLWTRESGWNHRARNRYSGAYGIPQAVPGGKMRSAGRDWRTNPRTQIRWGLGYIKHQYGSPCRAWRHARATGWY